MKLISCNNCAVMLDHDKLRFPTDIQLLDGSYDLTKSDWNPTTREYEEFIPCPVCKSPVFKESNHER